ncbi:MAG: PAS-domain containing protein, partial [Acetobacteraceae bacterium]|nr:PAS-domain containing protein [Acetobacteraceae bacterium]
MPQDLPSPVGAPPGDPAAAARALADHRLALDTMMDGLALWDAGFRLRVMNRSLIRLYDIPEALTAPGSDGRDILRLMVRRGDFGPAPDTEAAVAARVEERVRVMTMPTGGEPDLRTTRTGDQVEVTRTRLPDGGMLNSYRIVTRLKARERELQAARAVQNTVLETMTDGVVLWDADFRVVFANSAAERLGEFPAVFAKPGTEVIEVMRFQDRRGDFGPVPADDAELEARVQARAALLRRPEGVSYVRQALGGAWVEVKTVALPDGGAVLAYRDVTALKRREAELAAAQATQDLVLRTTSDGLLLLDADLRVRLVNPRALRLLDIPEAVARPGDDVREALRHMARRGDFGPRPEHAAGLEAMVAVRAAELLTATGDQPDLHRMPGGAWVEIEREPLPDGSSALITFRDVTRLKQREAELAAARDAAEAADQAKSAFLAAMSHEIRTPMNGVLGMMEVLELTPLSPDGARCVAVMRDSARALLRIIDDILDFSRIEAGRLELEPLPFSLRRLVQATAETLTVAAEGKGLRLLVEIAAPGPDLLLGDAVRVRQILLNLIGNAVKFTEAGEVRVAAATRAAPDGQVAVTLTVSDTGIGMDAAAVARLFRPFAQADSSTTRRYGGSGLGLSIVRRLAELMGGTATVESAPGEGSRFTVTLRLPAAAPASA